MNLLHLRQVIISLQRGFFFKPILVRTKASGNVVPISFLDICGICGICGIYGTGTQVGSTSAHQDLISYLISCTGQHTCVQISQRILLFFIEFVALLTWQEIGAVNISDTACPAKLTGNITLKLFR